jgi:hypothetical protein
MEKGKGRKRRMKGEERLDELERKRKSTSERKKKASIRRNNGT